VLEGYNQEGVSSASFISLFICNEGSRQEAITIVESQMYYDDITENYLNSFNG
jgi:hypothetical protein